ncbi:hypothetical protein COOONC_14487, partial [Cooperia oncophora]
LINVLFRKYVVERTRKRKASTRTAHQREPILEIWAHTEKIRKDSYAMNKDLRESNKILRAKIYDVERVVFELHCRDYINRHAISDKGYVKEIGKGLYLDLCAYDHSCRPNTIFTCDGFVATLRGLNSNVDIKNRSTTFYTYIDLLSSLQQRKKQLKDTWYFDCQCERCTDPSDHLLTSILCPTCPEIGKGLYLDLCAYDHSCRPNTIFTCDGFVATLRGLNSNVDIKNRSTTFYTYIDLLSSLQQRKKQLKDTWYFDCQCERCTDPSDHLLTSILCPTCPVSSIC